MIKRSGQLVLAAIDGLLAGRSGPAAARSAEESAGLAGELGSGPAELWVAGICKAFDGPPVLRGVGFTVGNGEFVTLLGPSGCGKTTLLRIIAGLERADAGEVVLCGRRITELPANRRPVNTVFQNYALFPHLSVRENVAFGLRARKVASAEVKERVDAALQMLQMEPFASRCPHQLSGGQKQRVALARALVNEPEVLLLDEPMSALDAKLRAEVQLELRRIQRKLGRTFILVTHDQDEAMTVSDRVLVMREGVIEQIGTPAEVYERPVNRFVAEFLGSANLIAACRKDGAATTAFGSLQVAGELPWKAGTLAIRPEHIRVIRHRAEQNGVVGRVRERVYRGDHTDLFVEANASDPVGRARPIANSLPSLRVRIGGRSELDVGQEVWLELPAEYLVVLKD